MTRTLTAHFDGKVIVPNAPVDLPMDTELIIDVRQATKDLPEGTLGEDFIAAARKLNFSTEDLEQMERAIEEGCERVDPDGW
ncbi:MAG TPA: hypothetical protein VKK61_07015 [Tepidisphaeraceae bacterium]|nr:hypothetical protein [Tepidisphaeraceae bacterium]